MTTYQEEYVAVCRELRLALEREEKLREALEGLLFFVPESGATLRAGYGSARALAVDALSSEPHGNFEDTQDTNPEGGC